MSSTCHDCRTRCDRDDMHVIKASTLSGRALICDPCHIAEVTRIRDFNRSLRAEGDGRADR